MLRGDILELMAEEISGHPVDAQASFVGFENGRPVLQGMSRGRLRDFDRSGRDTRMAEEARVVEIKRLIKLRSRRRKPEVYRLQGQRYNAEHREEKTVRQRERYWANLPLARAKRRAYRLKAALKRGLKQKSCGSCGAVGHNRRSHS